MLPVPAAKCDGFEMNTAPISITWEYKEKLNGIWRNSTQWPLAVDTNRNPTVVDFKEFTFAANTEHVLRAMVTSGDKSSQVSIRNAAWRFA